MKLKLWMTALLLLGLLLNAFRETEEISTIAFGSCSRQDKPQPMWEYIVANKPDLWIWLGDNIYGDTDDMKVLEAKYAQQKSHPGYQKLLASCPVVGVWDDHDYGRNDAGIGYPYKMESQQLMLDFLDEPKESERRKRQGVYTSYVYGKSDRQVKVILLDGRFHRDTLSKADKAYLPNMEGDMLGKAQWDWLEKELEESKAAVNIIACGIQFISEEHPYEKWANFPKARKRLFNMIGQSGARGVILLSGDRHIAEMARYEGPEVPYPIYEITASGLTHAHTANTGEPNKHRMGRLVNELNYGLIEIDWSKKPLQVAFKIKGIENKVLEHQQVTLAAHPFNKK